MNEKASISRGEMEVVRAVWDINQGGMGQIFEAMPTRNRPDYATVQTYVRRLEAKGVLTSQRIGRNKIYRAKIQPDEVIDDAVTDLVRQMFGGETLPLVRHLLSQSTMSHDELRQLRAMLDDSAASDDSKGKKS